MNRSARKILVVDDEKMIRFVMGRTLRKEGYVVFAASSATEGLAVLAREKVDLVISDHLMLDMTGLEFLKIVRDRYPGCIRVMLTGHADVDVAVEAINQGEIYRLLTKPWDDGELKVMLHIAFEMLDLERENRHLASMVRSQKGLIAVLEATHPSFTPLEGGDEEADGPEELQLVLEPN
ncbi:MAG: response regulator [Myxococcaceae bacterium]